MSKTPFQVPEVLVRVTQVQCLKQDRTVEEATAFFYAHQDGLYLVTNRHVVRDEEEGFFPEALRLRLHTDPSDLRKNATCDLALEGADGQPVWREHPAYGEEVDVVAIPLDKQEMEGRFLVRAFRQADHAPADLELGIGQVVLVLGYPLGFHDRLNNLPIVRDATIASLYPVPFEGKPYFLIDARLHGGTSGSPVIAKPTRYVTKGGQRVAVRFNLMTFLVGVHSATIDCEDRDPDQDEPLGLSVVWYPWLIPEIIQQQAATTQATSGVGEEE